jgi:aldehyde:ferredoxin oxidoreductase
MMREARYRGFWGTILWVDLARTTYFHESRPESFFRQYAGGGLLAAQLLRERTGRGVDPLGAENLLIFCNSIVSGISAAGLARFTVSAKSPLTMGIGETRCEGPWSCALKASGADAVVFSGRSPEPVAVLIEAGEVSFLEARALWGKDIGETCNALEHKLGKGLHVAAIGPAGESLVRFASVVTERTHQASRMGMGAVMGSKQLKAFVLRGEKLPPVADQTRLDGLSCSFAERIAGNPLSKWQMEVPGFSCWLHLHGLDAALCVNNYSRSSSAETENFAAAEFVKRYRSVSACPGCANDCIKIVHPLAKDTNLDARASGIHQEVTGSMGPNLGILDLDWVLRMNNLCNQQGLDPTSLGFVISFAMELREKNMLGPETPTFGDQSGAEKLVHSIIAREGLGDLLADGTKLAARRLGGNTEGFAMQVKGLEMVCFEPRTQTGLALGYATAPIGPRYDISEHDWDFDTKVGWPHSLDLTATLEIDSRIPMNELSAEKVRRFRILNNLWSAADALDFCVFAIAPTRILTLREMAATVAAVTGWETGDYELMRWGDRRNQVMRLYNLREGLTAADDRLPERFFNEPITEGPRKGDVLNRGKFQEAIRTYYELMGWDERGRPSDATLLDHRLLR